ncbi:ABC transporter permease [Bailinhaonella thermotolerans]|nr:ABC transporter permease [Bailinhaonella thermotolerans]
MAVRDVAVLARFGARLHWQDKIALTTAIALPLALGLGLPALFARLGMPASALLPAHLGLLATLLLLMSMNQIAVVLTVRRDQLVLKRLRATGMRDRDVLAGEIVNIAAQASLVSIALVLLARPLAGLTPPRDPLLLLVFLVAGALTLALLGAAWTAAIPRSELAAAMTMPFFMLAGFSSGGFGPIAELAPAWVRTAFELLPTSAVAEAARIAYDPAGSPATDLAAAAGPALTLAVWAAIGLAATARWFRWEPRRS